MATFAVYDWSHNKIGDITVSDDVFGATVKPHLHWEVVRWQQAKKRAGTHNTKTRSEVSGTGRKPYKQKGTGRARQGDFRSPLLRGGAVLFGPKPRSYDYALPMKVRRGALRSALSMLVRDQKVVVVKSFDELGAKTRNVAAGLKKLGVEKAVLVDATNEKLQRGTRNLPDHKYLAQVGINVYDLLRYGALVISETALKSVEERLLKA